MEASVTSRREPMPFIVGSPRSGTTLLRFMLDSHPELAIPPETGFFNSPLKFWWRGEKLRKKFFDSVVHYPRPIPSWPDFEIPEEVFREALSRINPFNASDGYRTFYRLYAERFGKPRWGDKTPLYCLKLNEIRRLLPEARFVHIIRDGRDAALSLRKMWFSPGWDMKTQASYWRNCVSTARRDGLGRDDYLEVRYEDLVLKTRETLEQICAHIRLSFDDSMLTYYTRSPERLSEHKGRLGPDGSPLMTQEQRIRQQQRTKEPPDPSCVYAWKDAMPANEQQEFRQAAGDLLRELGYEV